MPYHHVNLHDAELARHLATFPLFLANGRRPEADGTTVTLTDAALEMLADQLCDEDDGYFDGVHIWIGGTEYKVEEGAA